MARDYDSETVDFGDAEANALADLMASTPRYEFPYSDSIRETKESQGKYGVLNADEYSWDNQRCTREAYGDSQKHASGRHLTREDRNRRSLYFHTTWMAPEPALECIREVPEYNRFQPEYAADVVESFDHPAVWVVGREGSVVLYAWTRHPNVLADAMMGIRDAYMADLEDPAEADVFAPAGPDEIGAAAGVSTFPGTVGAGGIPADLEDGGTPAAVRLWWD